MRAAEKKMQREQRAQAEAWFAWFDLNGDGVLQRTERASTPAAPAKASTIWPARTWNGRLGLG